MGSPKQALSVEAPAHAPRAGTHLRLVEGSRAAMPRFASVWDSEALVERRVRRARNGVVLAPGQPFAGLVLVRFGSCKSTITGTNGLEQIASYHIAGETLGAESICSGVHDATVTALEESEFWMIPFAGLEAAARTDPSLQRHLCELLSHEIARDRRALVMLGTMRAEQRLAAFLLDLAARYAAAGYSSQEFVLRLTREEIGLHLGLSVETVSRLFTRLHQEGLIHARGKTVKIADGDGLHALRDGR